MGAPTQRQIAFPQRSNWIHPLPKCSKVGWMKCFTQANLKDCFERKRAFRGPHRRSQHQHKAGTRKHWISETGEVNSATTCSTKWTKQRYWETHHREVQSRRHAQPIGKVSATVKDHCAIRHVQSKDVPQTLGWNYIKTWSSIRSTVNRTSDQERGKRGTAWLEGSNKSFQRFQEESLNSRQNKGGKRYSKVTGRAYSAGKGIKRNGGNK